MSTVRKAGLVHRGREEDSSAAFVVVVISIIIVISALAIWWHRDTIFPSNGTDEVDQVPTGVDKDYLDSSLKELSSLNGMEISSSELADVPSTGDVRILSDEMTSIVNNNSSTTKVIVPIAGQNLLFVPAPSLVTVIMNGQIVPTVFVSADESQVNVYNPMSGEVTAYPFSSFSKSYDDAGRQCLFIADRGYSGY